ncbi:hypothetical protein N6H14_21175 [Paenibacillus sp. CC-CFT747]|nr:hypothetical protein N6H14_21175 [Paenibacillus sp. CC-CFT747]
MLRKIKKAEPDSIPMSNRVVGDYMFRYGGAVFFMLYGADPYGYRIQDGKIIPNVVLPEYKAAVELYRQLYAEGIFDKEFATTDGAKWATKWKEKNVLFQWNSADQLMPGAARLVALPGTDIADKNARVEFAPALKKYPSVLKDPKYAQNTLNDPIVDHGLYISSKSKNPDAAFKVIEAFASDKLREAIFWGKEGETYTMKDGKRIPIAEKLGADSRRWVKSMAFLFGYTDGQDAQLATYEQQMGPDKYKKAYDSVKALGEEAKANGLGSIVGYSTPDEVVKKNSEIMQDINRFTSEAIMGKITMDQFDGEVKKWEAKYRSLKYDPMQKYIDANKEKLKGLNVKKVTW